VGWLWGAAGPTARDAREPSQGKGGAVADFGSWAASEAGPEGRKGNRKVLPISKGDQAFEFKSKFEFKKPK
jgi:hypothetical protein